MGHEGGIHSTLPPSGQVNSGNPANRGNINGRHKNIFAKNKTKKLMIDRKFMASHDFAVTGGF